MIHQKCICLCNNLYYRTPKSKDLGLHSLSQQHWGNALGRKHINDWNPEREKHNFTINRAPSVSMLDFNKNQDRIPPLRGVRG